MKAVILLALLLVACSSEVIPMEGGDDGRGMVMDDENVHAGNDGGVMDDHMGCQEGEIDVDGNCVPAEENTAGLFEQDFSTSVTTRMMTEPVQGYLARPSIPGTYPGVVMIHEWWGLNDNIKYMAELLANEGYVVYAVDLYGGEVATESSRAGELASSVRNNPDEAIEKMRMATQYLRSEGAQEIASLGWCFGGQQSLQLSLNEEIDATIIYYGNLVDDQERLMNINGPVLGIFGEEDNGIPPSDVRSFETALNEVGIQNDIYIYDDVGHAFANPSGSRYAAEETKDAWSKTVVFLEENLG